MSLAGLRLICLESRRAQLVEDLIQRQGGICFNAPSVREVALEENEPCLKLVRDLVEDKYDALVLTTGVGAQYLIDAAASIDLERRLIDILKRLATVSRGPKPAAVLRALGAPAKINVPEPNTWREVADAMRDLPPHAVAVQEYGVENPEFIAMLRALGFEVTSVPVYRWAPPLDLGPLEEAARRIAAADCDVVLLLSSVQLTHLLDVSATLALRDAVIARLRNDIVVGSIGPIMTEALERAGIAPDFTSKHPKLAICIRQLAQEAPRMLAEKRAVRR